ncbi:peroxisomal membrane anchor protein (Pex14), putative [Talaromyces stipitatus ATCC 10500]|uniref:Peroxisomal membrane protein PEX14 n=1 Tax=Talaromyces stipitatus (strain ATCC 10500 / CBS 375.48 / QM 6759 / NRRL 1006) TaxID=441959 RepID=B8M7I1_TALSN|nr:peroxisomal membrane anchor protein (Pex14), putative [Talaromyces stipitatus ATCC 10500]EED19534.1 peroxisomal membrane anchor protein (Pex14), putative [Talaromyces stipitatus ATCC 10500]
MAPREELISSAVTFLQDPSVASSPLEKRVAFLQSKNLTQEEIEIAIARAGEESVQTTTTTTTSPVGYNQQQSPVYRPTVPQSGYGPGPYGQWQPPPDVPRRDWRDWFIMATITGGVGYGLYVLAKRYVVPIIAPPTPPQLEQDKQSIDDEFARAFALIDQLSTDTAALKSAEEARTERLDAALREVENVLSELKSSTRRRDDETRRISDEVKNLKDSIPKALEGAREGNENKLKELGTELRSLKTLLNNRLSAGNSTSTPATGRPLGSTPEPASSPAIGLPATTPSTTVPSNATISSASNSQTSSSAASANPLSQLGKSASIPAWQMAAANRSKTPQSAAPTHGEESQSSAPAS